MRYKLQLYLEGIVQGVGINKHNTREALGPLPRKQPNRVCSHFNRNTCLPRAFGGWKFSPDSIPHFRWFKKHSRDNNHSKGQFHNCVALINKQNIYQYYILVFMIIKIVISRNIRFYYPISKYIILNNYNIIFYQ